MSDVTIHIASAAERKLVENLFQFYVYDFSEFASVATAEFEFAENGQFAPSHVMDAYWTDAGRRPLLIRSGTRLVGFALLNKHAHSGAVVDWNMGEFFIARKFRRSGMASSALRKILAAYPGVWEIAVARRNAPAKEFWPKAIGAAPNVTGISSQEINDDRWRGPIWTFAAAAGPHQAP